MKNVNYPLINNYIDLSQYYYLLMYDVNQLLNKLKPGDSLF